MRAIAAHFRYISKNGRLDIEDDRGETIRGSRAVRDLAEDWRLSGGLIPEDAGAGGRREAFNIMLSMPRGTDPLAVHRAARAFARVELADNKYVMVLHDHQANPHVHISVRAESRKGTRLNPRKADLIRWRCIFAERLRELGVDAEATRQATRGVRVQSEGLWRIKAQAEGRLRRSSGPGARGAEVPAFGPSGVETWNEIRAALGRSNQLADILLGKAVDSFLKKDVVRTGRDEQTARATPMWAERGSR